MGTLKENLTEIKRQKDTYLLPENLKQGVTCLGITGTLAPGSEIGGGVKLFATVDEMNADPNPQEGDLAVVYRNEMQNATADSRFQTATFPDTVVLDTAITDYVEVRYRAVDSSVMFDCMGNLDSSSFRMDCYTETGNIRIQYTSSDGITYTRTDTTGNPVDFGTEIYYEMAEMWNDAIGKFIQVGGSTFEGLYEYKTVKNEEVANLYSIYDNNHVIGSNVSGFITMNEIKKACDIVLADRPEINGGSFTIWKNQDGTIELAFQKSTCFYQYKVLYEGITYMGYSSGSGAILVKYTFTNLDNEEFTSVELTEEQHTVTFNGRSDTIKIYRNTLENYVGFTNVDVDGSLYHGSIGGFIVDNGTMYNSGSSVYPENADITKYVPAPNQFTLSNASEILPNVIALGSKGVVKGDGSIIVPDNTFADTSAMLWSNIQKQYDNMQPRVLTNDDKTIDKNIYSIPVKSDGTPLLNTSNVTNMGGMFYNCTNLIIIPLLDTSNVTNMTNMFANCTNLTTISQLNTSSVTNMDSMFASCTNLTEIPQLNTSNVTNMEGMFYECTNLATISLLDTSKVTNMVNMFSGCTNLTEIPQLNTSKVTNMNNMFRSCTKLTETPLLDTNSVTSMGGMFYKCTNLATIPLLDTSKVTNMEGMFNSCTNLTTIPLLDTSKVTNMDNIFKVCPSLSDESLNNILAMCTNATSYTSTKRLNYIGLTSEQATKCTTLSNYSAFTSAGWTTGY